MTPPVLGVDVLHPGRGEADRTVRIDPRGATTVNVTEVKPGDEFRHEGKLVYTVTSDPIPHGLQADARTGDVGPAVTFQVQYAMDGGYDWRTFFESGDVPLVRPSEEDLEAPGVASAGGTTIRDPSFG